MSIVIIIDYYLTTIMTVCHDGLNLCSSCAWSASFLVSYSSYSVTFACDIVAFHFR